MVEYSLLKTELMKSIRIKILRCHSHCGLDISSFIKLESQNKNVTKSILFLSNSHHLFPSTLFFLLLGLRYLSHFLAFSQITLYHYTLPALLCIWWFILRIKPINFNVLGISVWNCTSPWNLSHHVMETGIVYEPECQCLSTAL